MSIIRVGLSETKHFAEGYDAIFGKRKESQSKEARAVSKSSTPKKKRKPKKK